MSTAPAKVVGFGETTKTTETTQMTLGIADSPIKTGNAAALRLHRAFESIKFSAVKVPIIII